MTLPDERIRAVRYTREFLRDLLDPKKTPRVPRAVRLEAYRLLKHYPGDFYLNNGKEPPGIFGKYHDPKPVDSKRKRR